MARVALPESFEREEAVHGGSDRSFGLVFTAFFLLVGLAPLLHGGHVRWWSVALAAAFLVVALVRPALLKPLNRLWTKFGLLLHKIVNPVIMGAIFYVAITPFGVVMRLLGKDPLRRRFDAQAPSYWIERTPPGPAPQSMSNQF
ncbi:MAG: SxtJ family membrane protein [Dongiaceae bacterium]